MISVNQLIPHLEHLRTSLLPEINDPRYNVAATHLDMLPFTLGAAEYAFEEGIQAQQKVVTQLTKGLEPNVRLHPTQAQRDRLAYPIDSFLEAARRAQNAVIFYVSRAHKRSLDHSLRDLMKKITSKKLELGYPLDQILTGYWTTHGERLADYRDLSQHVAIVSSDVSVFTGKNGEPCFHLLLPSNPEIKNAAKLQWGAPRVHAYMYVRSQFMELIGFVFHITRFLDEQFPRRPNPDGTLTVRLTTQTFRQPLVLGGDERLEGQRLFTCEGIEKELRGLPNRLEETYTKNMKAAGKAPGVVEEHDSEGT